MINTLADNSRSDCSSTLNTTRCNCSLTGTHKHDTLILNSDSLRVKFQCNFRGREDFQCLFISHPKSQRELPLLWGSWVQVGCDSSMTTFHHSPPTPNYFSFLVNSIISSNEDVNFHKQILLILK